jgi:hypothetical protein
LEVVAMTTTIEDVRAAMARHYGRDHGAYDSPDEAIGMAVWGWWSFTHDLWDRWEIDVRADQQPDWDRRLDELAEDIEARMAQWLRDEMVTAAETFMAEFPDAPGKPRVSVTG